MTANTETTSGTPRLTVVLGAPADLETHLLQRIAAARAEHPLAPLDVVVGGVLLRPYLQRLVADATPGLVNVRMSTLGELGLRLGEPALAAAGRRPLPAIAERALSGEVARGCDGYFAPVAGTPGFAEASRRTLRELRQEGIDPDTLARHAPATLESEEKAADLVALARRSADARAGFYDGLDALAHADGGRLDGTELILVGVTRLGAVAGRLVARIATRIPVTVLLPSLHPDADQAHAELRGWLATQGAGEVRLEPTGGGTALAHLQRDLLRATAPVSPDPSVDLVSAPDPLAETREVARVCLDWAARGIPFRDMAVTYRQAEVYRPLVEAVFTEAGIPVYLDDGPGLAERPLGRRILALVDLIGSTLPRRDVMAFLTDGWMPKETRERFGNASPATWDAISRRAGVVEGPDQWAERLALHADGLRRQIAEKGAEEWRERRVRDTEGLAAFIAELSSRIAAHPTTCTWGEALDHLRPLLVAYVSDAEDVIGYLDQLRDLDRITGPVAFTRFLDVVRAEVRAMKAGDLDEGRQGAFGRRGVNVLDVNQLRNLRFRAVAVLGLTERAFPPPPRQDPLLLDAERRRLNAAGGITIPLRAQGADPEPLQFALAVHAAREALLLSTRRAEEAGGRAQLPSAFFRQAASALAGRRVQLDEIASLKFVRRLRAGRAGADDPARSLTIAERDRAILESDPPLGRALLESIEPRAARADALRRARWGDRDLTPFDATFADGGTRERMAAWLEEHLLSPTGLESYAVCPFRFFLASVLHVTPQEEPETVTRISPLDRGSVMHVILQRLVERLGAAPAPATASSARSLLRAIAEEELDAVEARGLTGAPLLWETDRRQIVDDLARWLELEIQDGAGHPSSAVEVSFGRPDDGRPRSPLATDDPVAIEVGGRTIRVRGVVDRIDHGGPGAGFRVVDYKSGSRWGLPKDQKLNRGRGLQLPLYLLAGAMILGTDVATGQAAYHLVSRRGDFRRIAFDGATLDARRDDFERVIGRIAGGAATGDFHPEPGEACRHCDYRDLCDVGKERLRQRKSGDPRSLSFAALGEIE